MNTSSAAQITYLQSHEPRATSIASTTIYHTSNRFRCFSYRGDSLSKRACIHILRREHSKLILYILQPPHHHYFQYHLLHLRRIPYASHFISPSQKEIKSRVWNGQKKATDQDEDSTIPLADHPDDAFFIRSSTDMLFDSVRYHHPIPLPTATTTLISPTRTNNARAMCQNKFL